MNSFSVKQYNQEVTQLFVSVARTAVLAQPSQGLTSTITAPQVSLPSQTETLIRASQKSLQTIVGQMGDFSQKLPADWKVYVNSAVHPVVTEGATPTVNQVNLAIEVLKAVGYLPVNRSDVMAYGAFLETTFKNERFNPCQVMFVGALQSLKANTLLPDFFSRPIALIGSALAITTSVYVLYDNLGEELRVNLLGLADEMTRLVPQAIAKESAQGMSREEAAKVFSTLASRGMLGSLAASAAPVVPEVSEEEKSLSVPISSRPSLLNDFFEPLKNILGIESLADLTIDRCSQIYNGLAVALKGLQVIRSSEVNIHFPLPRVTGAALDYQECLDSLRVLLRSDHYRETSLFKEISKDVDFDTDPSRFGQNIIERVSTRLEALVKSYGFEIDPKHLNEFFKAQMVISTEGNFKNLSSDKKWSKLHSDLEIIFNQVISAKGYFAKMGLDPVTLRALPVGYLALAKELAKKEAPAELPELPPELLESDSGDDSKDGSQGDRETPEEEAARLERAEEETK